MSILDALAGAEDFSNAPVKDSPAVDQLDIALSDIAPDPDQPRKSFDQSVIDSLAEQFQDPEIGQLEPIFVRKLPRGNSGAKYLIVHGETRYRAATQAELETIKAIVTADYGFVRQLLSNETRADLDMFDKARAYQQVIDEHKISQKRLAQILGKNPSEITRYLKLLDLPELARQAYTDGKATSVRVLDALASLIETYQKPAAKRKRVEQFIAESSSITVASINTLSKALSTEKRTPKIKPMIDGKAVSVKAINGDVITFKSGKETLRYRLVSLSEQEANTTGDNND